MCFLNLIIFWKKVKARAININWVLRTESSPVEIVKNSEKQTNKNTPENISFVDYYQANNMLLLELSIYWMSILNDPKLTSFFCFGLMLVKNIYQQLDRVCKEYARPDIHRFRRTHIHLKNGNKWNQSNSLVWIITW